MKKSVQNLRTLFFLLPMLKKGQKIYSVLKEKCPICHNGDVFLTKHKYDLKKFDKMHERCPSCGHKFEIEGGFWQGAMYVSYAVTVAYSIATFVLTYLINQQTTAWMYIAIIGVVSIIVAPLNYRISRMIWMNLFSKFDATK